MMTRLASALALTFTALSCGPLARGDIEGPHGITGFRTQGAIFWVVPVEGGVVVVDSGDDDEGARLVEAVAGRTVVAVLITHGHDDHFAGIHKLGENVRVLVGDEDIPRIRGLEENQGLLQRAVEPLGRPSPKAPAHMEGIRDGHVLRVGQDTFTAIGLPGHTPGSMAYLYKDVLFGGDAAMGGTNVAPAPWLFSDDDVKARESIQKLRNVEFKTLLDGHNGRTDDADQRVH